MTLKHIVTGAAGFIGSTLTQRLLDRGDEVVGVDCLTDYYSEKIKRDNLEPLLAHQRFRRVRKNVLDTDWPALLEGVGTVFHLAAQPGVRASWGKTFRSYTDHNVLATQTLLEAVKEKGIRVVYASSSSVYGDAASLPMREDDLPKPFSPYGVTKLAAEHLCCLYWRNFQTPTVSLRFFTVYGPKQRPDMAFHRFIKAGLRGEPITLYGEGEQTRDFTYVADIVDACLQAAVTGREGGVYNLGGGSRISINRALEILERVLNRRLKVNRLEKQTGDVRDTYADTSLARADLQFHPSRSLEEGLAREAEWIESKLTLLD